MEKLEQLKLEMIQAREAYEKFQENNSRELTQEEKENQKDCPQFIGMVSTTNSETRMFELTEDNYEEYRQVYEKMNETRNDFLREYTGQNKK